VTCIALSLPAVLALALAAGSDPALAAARGQEAQELPSPERLAPLRAYIKKSWSTLTRSTHDLARAAPDPKFPRGPGQRWPVYLSPREDRARVEQELARTLTAEQRATIELRPLPADRTDIEDHGLLYLPRPYVVPGGRFNEMYGWDSYFIQAGLLRDGEQDLARDMVDNFVYEIDHYGTILNANRTYYLSRSQPPFLTEMVLAVHRRAPDRAWLAATVPAIEKYYRYWTTGPHLAGTTGLSRYWDSGQGPAPEVVAGERDEGGRGHYDRVREYYRTHRVTEYDLALYYDRRRDELTPLFYRGDRSLRESGFDPSGRFGPFSVDIIHHAPVCLNALLYRMELDTAEILAELGRAGEATVWRTRARRRRSAVDRYLWDERSGRYLDYDFRRGQRRSYEFATTFYPLWAGLASPAQARQVRDNLGKLEAAGGLLTSTRVTGSQWDAPFGWAPLQLIAVSGLRRYGFEADAARLSRKFIAVVTKEFEEHGGIMEKYDVRRRESDVAKDIRFGYSSNEVGFGWTNAVVLELLAGLGIESTAGSERRREAARLVGTASPAAVTRGRVDVVLLAELVAVLDRHLLAIED
jgi:alpha,alpha-trehalase